VAKTRKAHQKKLNKEDFTNTTGKSNDRN